MQTFLSTIKSYLQSNNMPYPSSVRVGLPNSSEAKFEGNFLDFMNNNFSSAISGEIDKSKEISDNQDKDYRFSNNETTYVINF